MTSITIDRSFDSWRIAARSLLAQQIRPENVLWDDGSSPHPLLQAPAAPLPPSPPPRQRIAVPAEFVEVAQDAALHRDPDRWPLLYRVLWRISQGERRLIKIEIDPDIRRLLTMQRQVGCDRHRMLGFVRFRSMKLPEGEHYVAWYKPDHYVVRSAAGSFASRFSVMHWSIFTPDESVHWDGRRLAFTPGLPEPPQTDDQYENLWRCYYRSAFIPSRANPKALAQHIPHRYRAALPEAQEIPGLLDLKQQARDK